MSFDQAFKSKLWKYDGPVAWHFITMPKDLSDEIRELSESFGPRKGFGSVKIEVTLNDDTWQTSAFPDSRTGCFIVPVKKAIRQNNSIEDGSQVTIAVRCIDL